jgi:hypothetical protein
MTPVSAEYVPDGIVDDYDDVPETTMLDGAPKTTSTPTTGPAGIRWGKYLHILVAAIVIFVIVIVYFANTPDTILSDLGRLQTMQVNGVYAYNMPLFVLGMVGGVMIILLSFRRHVTMGPRFMVAIVPLVVGVVWAFIVLGTSPLRTNSLLPLLLAIMIGFLIIALVVVIILVMNMRSKRSNLDTRVHKHSSLLPLGLVFIMSVAAVVYLGYAIYYMPSDAQLETLGFV